MKVEKANESITYDVELEDDKHCSVTFDKDCNIGYSDVTILDEEENEIKDGTELYDKILAEVNAFKEHENDNT